MFQYLAVPFPHLSLSPIISPLSASLHTPSLTTTLPHKHLLQSPSFPFLLSSLTNSQTPFALLFLLTDSMTVTRLTKDLFFVGLGECSARRPHPCGGNSPAFLVQLPHHPRLPHLGQHLHVCRHPCSPLWQCLLPVLQLGYSQGQHAGLRTGGARR